LAAGQALSGISADIIRALIEAGESGMTVQDLAKKLKSTGGTISVWMSTTGKNLVRKIEPGRYSAFPEIKSKEVEKPESAPVPADKNFAEASALRKADPRGFSVAMLQRHFRLGHRAATELLDLVIDSEVVEGGAK
jgi:hypothetical protein